MLFMAVFQYDPSDREEVIDRRLAFDKEKAGVNVIGEWFDLSGHRVFCLIEAEDEVHLASAVFPWSGIGYVEIVPVMEMDKAIKLYKKLSK
ncbi:DUF3303 domain-containing protein [Thermodesulforhabdus norvegica]|uniref:DUF3303 domain-containing protein n=1 Tax=Thermodesulforhabdus norvegica TaxID=39841 RepID=A0A1I4QUU0_9BACT|nr:DUF3303 family protein [Thermodesulforhabdus norvegica]SFM43834.1 Protein of unknown function [Thermodesulforhabdus norvegica]